MDDFEVGEVVVVIAKMKTVRDDIPKDMLIKGTFIGRWTGKVQVLLPTGEIFTGELREIIPLNGQEE